MRRAPEFAAVMLRPWRVHGALAGLCAGEARLRFPGIGLETELGVAVRGARGNVVPALQALLDRRGDLGAGTLADPTVESDRQFSALGASYREGDHLELNTWFHRSGAAARWNLELWLQRAAELAAADDRVLLHATGGDPFGSSWSSLHVNVALSDLGYDRLLASQRACDVVLGWYLPAQLSLAVVDGNGGIGPNGFLVSDRIGAFDAVFGSCTLRPFRALVVDRPEGFGNARAMCMLRALSFGRASVAGLVATQLDVLIADLMVHGLVRAEPIAIGDPIACARELAGHDQRHAAAAMQRDVQAVRWRVVEWLAQQLGDAVFDEFLPGVCDELRFIDRALGAIAGDDEAELLQCCDWARKLAVLRDHLRGRSLRWSAALPALQELNVHYARLDRRALRHLFDDAAMPAMHRPDVVPTTTSSWLLHWLCARAADDAPFRRQLDRVQIRWQGLRRSVEGWVEPQGSAWPWARRREQTIDLEPHRFTQRELATPLAGVASVDDLFALLGTETSHYGDYAGRAYGSDPAGAAMSDPTEN